ncbi:MAG: hypothetical protein FWE19_06190 [Oscillospiraceae bacterium]|nr:hypothetical protein [Oscillospiraceae bacterium]
MKSKKIIVLVLVLALALVAVGCATNQPTPPPVAPTVDEDDYDYGYEYGDVFELGDGFEDFRPEIGIEFEGQRYGEQEFSDENVQLTVFFDRPQFTHSDVVGVFATITNIGEEIVVFTKGSGSNRVPDALTVNLGELTALFHPAVMTMDLQTSWLEPGESVTFALPFAPYTHTDTDAAFPPMIGFDRDIEFFQGDDEWVRVQVGEIAGSVSFSYVTRGADDFFIIVEGDEIFELEGSFAVNLTEHEMSGTPTAPEAANGEADAEVTG